MFDTDTPAARAAAARAVLRLLAGLARRPLARSGAAASTAAAATGEAFELARRRGWIEPDPAAGGWRLAASGREFLRRALSGQDPAEAGTAVRAGRDAAPAASAPEIDPDESPLAWLRRRKGKDGQPLIAEDEFQAGERLRADFWFAGMTPRVTSAWGAGPSSGGRRSAPGAGADLRDSVIAAQARVSRALAAVGPELAGILVDVCCHLKGIEDAERQAGWPQRAGKVVLRLALARLARHYGIGHGAPGAARERIRHWGAAGYRPELEDAAARTADPATEGNG